MFACFTTLMRALHKCLMVDLKKLKMVAVDLTLACKYLITNHLLSCTCWLESLVFYCRMQRCFEMSLSCLFRIKLGLHRSRSKMDWYCVVNPNVITLLPKQWSLCLCWSQLYTSFLTLPEWINSRYYFMVMEVILILVRCQHLHLYS